MKSRNPGEQHVEVKPRWRMRMWTCVVIPLLPRPQSCLDRHLVAGYKEWLQEHGREDSGNLGRCSRSLLCELRKVGSPLRTSDFSEVSSNMRDWAQIRAGQWVSSSTVCLLGNAIVELSVEATLWVDSGIKYPDQLLISVKSSMMTVLGQNRCQSKF